MNGVGITFWKQLIIPIWQFVQFVSPSLKFPIKLEVCTYFLWGLITMTSPYLREKRKSSDLVLWQNPLHPQKNIQKATGEHIHATKNFDNTTIAEWLRTGSWGNDSQPTAVVKPVNEIPTLPLTKGFKVKHNDIIPHIRFILTSFLWFSDDTSGVVRRFFINRLYRGCSRDTGWLVVTDAQRTRKCDVDKVTKATVFFSVSDTFSTYTGMYAVKCKISFAWLWLIVVITSECYR